MSSHLLSGSDFCFDENQVDCGTLLISVRMRALSAPHMSFGSRANQAKPEALSSCSEQYPMTAILRETAGLRPHLREDLLRKSFLRAWTGPRTGARTGAENFVRAGEQEHFGY
jgi:hypothetical protein